MTSAQASRETEPVTVKVLPAIDVTDPTNACGLVKGIETSVSELLRQEVVVKPTGSVTTDWAKPNEARSIKPNEMENAEITRGEA